MLQMRYLFNSNVSMPQDTYVLCLLFCLLSISPTRMLISSMRAELKNFFCFNHSYIVDT